jgi:carboxymethylenebutenolidase
MNYFQRYLVEEFAEDYEEGHMSRREALKLIAAVTGSMLVASSILAACTPMEETVTPAATVESAAPTTSVAVVDPTLAATETAAIPETGATPAAAGTVAVDDPDVQGSDVEFPGEGATLLGYLARPAQDGPFPVVLVCHENRGLTEHIKDVTRRLAKAGYVALAVDLLSRQGGSATLGPDNVSGALGNTLPEQFVQEFRSGWTYLQEQPFANAEQVGMVGFCFGGGVTWLMATQMPELKAAVPFYGPNPPLEDVPDIQAAVLAMYGEQDERINAGIPEIEEAMQQNNKTFEKVIYPGAGHAFHNDTGRNFNPEAAQDAWRRTLEWFNRYLS